ncbi:MAG TPA: HAD family hydrolase [Solirubrobacteraceae bacterium]|nr:HAD family hydrolase [Solirubrobacteraceae bacterium]
MVPRLIATDLDGTLLRSDGSLDERTRRALSEVEAAGIAVVICTARPARWLRPLAEATGHRGVAICANGGVLWDLHTETVVEQSPLPSEIALEVVSRLRAALPQGHWAVERATGFGHEPGYATIWPVPDDTEVDAIDVLLRPAAPPPVKLMLRHPEITADDLLAHARALIGNLAEASHSSARDTLLEISAAGVSKATALADLCRRAGVAAADVVAFGDMPNDLPMLVWAGTGVAVANAHEEVIAAADEVTASNDEGGVAQVLERFLARL